MLCRYSRKVKKTSPSNYRPVSLTVNVCKVFESSVRDEMIKHLEEYALIKDSQHGFIRNKSCLTYLFSWRMSQVTLFWVSSWRNIFEWLHERTEHLDIFLFFRSSLNGVLFPMFMFCLLVEGECQILVF